jgi:hypothetical protein
VPQQLLQPDGLELASCYGFRGLLLRASDLKRLCLDGLPLSDFVLEGLWGTHEALLAAAGGVVYEFLGY